MELLGVLAAARRRGVISARERRLLLELVGACRARPGMVTGRNGGLTNRAAAGVVARRWGVAEVTIRRRAARAIGSLAGAGSRRELWPVPA